ncbi:MAG: DUF2273 domain-containing protein [Thermanaeromonas sp.]|uniref:DUF2273 domain-containing protein n=1 Tax=Thermanaeromonas sp. TaxID=2003697 RepID=UPI00243E6453|nr:DUF2273 domain-containing protein [Thermanaeromonas sp.]MCG0277618.1 DUF2273 domain-containing protein [Thermanaeromonas sp.]
MGKDELLKIWREHRGKILGLALGLLFGLAVAAWGLLKTLFIVFCMMVGYFIGRGLDGGQGWSGWWERILRRRW